MAPLEQPHWIGTKRPSLEQDYYEMIDRPNVTVVDLKKTPIVAFEEQGIRTSEKLLEFDIVVLATGYDALTGSLKDIGLVDTDGVSLSKKWEKGTYTYMGLMVPKMPNMFMVYSPQAPTSLANGPAIIEKQVDWIAEAVGKMREQDIESIDAHEGSAEKWRATVQELSNMTLFKGTKSWYTGANIEGKKLERLVYLGGLDQYDKIIHGVLAEGDNQWAGFHVAKSSRDTALCSAK